jgi:hypothetical protein
LTSPVPPNLYGRASTAGPWNFKRRKFMPLSPSDPDYHEILAKYRQEAQQERKAIARNLRNFHYKQNQKNKNDNETTGN